MHRRHFLQAAAAAGGLSMFGAFQLGDPAAVGTTFLPFGDLQGANADGLQLPPGFESRIVATTGQTVAGTDFRWHPNPDGGATFAHPDGGWIYVSNDEANDGEGGVSMLRFGPDADIVDARQILSGTSRNCAGGPTPWGTWLSCEEFDGGRVWECDPLGEAQAVVHPAMGTFSHEAAAADPDARVIYLTEDKSEGALYRFTPDAWGDLSAGVLEAMTEDASGLGWAQVPDPTASSTPTRFQVPNVKPFAGGEGAWFDDGLLYFTTKRDNRVWRYEPASNTLDIIYDIETAANPILSGVDNIVMSGAGDLFVCEDGGNMEVVVLRADGHVGPFLRMAIGGSEVTGVAFDPSGTRMYVSSQRNPGTTFEISGPFLPAPEQAPEPTGSPQPPPTPEQATGDAAASGIADRRPGRPIRLSSHDSSSPVR